MERSFWLGWLVAVVLWIAFGFYLAAVDAPMPAREMHDYALGLLVVVPLVGAAIHAYAWTPWRRSRRWHRWLNLP